MHQTKKYKLGTKLNCHREKAFVAKLDFLAELKVRENQKNDAGISIAILNIPFHYLKLLQLCCLNFPAL